MQLSPLQSRLMASVLASLLLLILYLLLFPPSLALAAELSSIINENAHRTIQEVGASPDMYEPTFAAFDRSIMGRQTLENIPLLDGEEQKFELSPGDNKLFMIDVSSVSSRRFDVSDEAEGPELKKRQSATRVCVSANTCKRPDNTNEETQTTLPAPQLTMWLSTNPENTSPSPSGDPNQQEAIVFDQGALHAQIDIPSSAYFAIAAPTVIEDFEGIYSFEIVASIGEKDTCFYSFDGSSSGNITWINSDDSGAILEANFNVEDNSTQAPYTLFAQSRLNDWKVNGSLASFCGMKEYAEFQASTDSTSSVASSRITKRQQGSGTQNFVFKGMEDNSFYWGVLAQDRRVVSGDGVTVFSATNFTTASG